LERGLTYSLAVVNTSTSYYEADTETFIAHALSYMEGVGNKYIGGVCKPQRLLTVVVNVIAPRFSLF